MRQLALDFLYSELKGTGDTEEWYRQLRRDKMEVLFPYLIEAARDSMASNYYVIYPDEFDDNIAILEQRVFKEGVSNKLPFVQSTGSQSPALGPVIKRSYSKAKGAGPSGKILNSTLKAFAKIAENEKPWSDYFSYAHQLFSRPILQFGGNDFEDKLALHSAIGLIDESKTAYLSILDIEGSLPGERQDYRMYLQEVLATEKYSTKAFAPIDGKSDSLTGETTKVYPNGLKGAGLNLTNVDRVGVFSNIDDTNAWKKFALSAANADLLYTFSFHLREDFVGRIAGEPALVLPQLTFEQAKRQKFVAKFKSYINNLNLNSKGTDIQEKRLLRYYKDFPEAIANITIVWAKFGQSLEDVTGIVNDILPSRLATISQQIDEVNELKSSVFPTNIVQYVEPDLALNSLASLLKRPGGKKNKKVNQGARLFELKRDTAARVYQGRQIAMNRFWDEALATAKEYLMEIAESGSSFGLINEGSGKKGNFLTLAGWIKHLAKYIYFLRKLEVYEAMGNWTYTPKQESLKPFFKAAEETAGLDNKDKVYTFLLGVLFGKVMEVQSARGVNVGANALTWLKRLNITGADLPNLYNKVREKLLAYETESRREVAEIVAEIGSLGVQIGTPKLNKVDACYYLLLGQSLTKTLIPPKTKHTKEEEQTV